MTDVNIWDDDGEDVFLNTGAAKIALRHATNLGQPVGGTSGGSTYITCMLHEGFAIALRDNGGTISLRVEPRGGGELTGLLQKQFKTLGFNGEKGTYMSQHFKAEGGALVACGAYGAVAEQIRFLFGEEKTLTLPWKELVGAGN